MNKIIVSVVLTLILVVGINKMTDVIYNVQKPEKSAYQVASTTTATSTSEEKVSQDSQTGDIMALLASASLADGEKVFKKCAACHSIAKGGSNKIGPALYNVLGRNMAGLEDYKYSKALIAFGKSWTFQEMNSFLIKPTAYIKGTKMAFAGLKKEKDRASVILYMNSKSDSPLQKP